MRCLTRRPEAVAPHRDTTTIVAGDVLELESLRPAMRGIETAYYLVHSMTAAVSFEEQDRRCAANFAAAAREAGVRRIVYLGGLGAGSDLSSHLAQPPGSRPHSRRLGRADDRVPGLDRDRLGQPLLRDAPHARRAPAGDDHAALGAHQGAADRDRGRARLPRSGARRRARGQRGVRDRRRRRGLLRGADARVRAAARPPPLDRSRCRSSPPACRASGSGS